MTFGGPPMRNGRLATCCVCCGGASLQRSPAVLMPFVAHRVFEWVPVTIDESWGLKTLKTGQAYSICNSLFCIECGHLFLDIRFTDEEMGRLYDDYRGESYTHLRESYEPGYRARNDGLNLGINYLPRIESFLEPFLTFPIRILDWGGDTGKNTPFKHRAEAIHIYDISEKTAVSGARSVVFKEILPNTYELIVCSHVLEHIPYPADPLRQIHSVMGPRSVLYIELPFEGVMRQSDRPLMQKKHWHEHINFFSESSLLQLLKGVGFDVLALDTFDVTGQETGPHVFQLACKITS